MTLGQLTRNVQRKLAEMDLSVRMRKQGNEDAWKFVLLTDVGKEHMDAIREQAAKLMQTANGGMQASQAQVRRTLNLARAGIALVATAALLAFYLYLRQTTRLKLPASSSRPRCSRSVTCSKARCASAPPRWRSWPRTCSRCARKSAATWRANCTTNSAPCSPPPSSMSRGSSPGWDRPGPKSRSGCST